MYSATWKSGESPAGNSRPQTGHPAANSQLSSSVLCARDPDTALNAGQCRLLTKLGERGGGSGVVGGGCFVQLKEVHAIKNSLPSCQCVTIKNSWAGLLSAFSHVQVDSLFCAAVVSQLPLLLPPFVAPALCGSHRGRKVSLIKRVHFGFTGLR